MQCFFFSFVWWVDRWWVDKCVCVRVCAYVCVSWFLRVCKRARARVRKSVYTRSEHEKHLQISGEDPGSRRIESGLKETNEMRIRQRGFRRH